MVKKIALLVCSLSAQTALAVNAEDVSLPVEKHREAEAPGEMEEVTVYGQKSLLNLKRVMIKAEDKTFAVFNSLNIDSQYDIRCHKEAPTGSHIKRRICNPRFVYDLMNEEAARWGAGARMNDFPDSLPIINVAKWKKKEKNLREIWGSLAAEHPELLNAIKSHSEAKKIYTSEKEERCGRQIIVCLKSKY